VNPPRGLSDAEASAWARLAASVEPLAGKARPKLPADAPSKAPDKAIKAIARPAPKPKPTPTPPPRPLGAKHGLDNSWERKLSRAAIAPDFTLDLHGNNLDAAWTRLDDGLAQAKAMGARLVLVVTGKPRPVDPADRGTRRGAIRAKILDWLAAGRHAGDIAAIRKAHRRHGGEGALYIVLRKG
jgi:DNA-nicking Smr family endonuclease